MRARVNDRYCVLLLCIPITYMIQQCIIPPLALGKLRYSAGGPTLLIGFRFMRWRLITATFLFEHTIPLNARITGDKEKKFCNCFGILWRQSRKAWRLRSGATLKYENIIIIKNRKNIIKYRVHPLNYRSHCVHYIYIIYIYNMYIVQVLLKICSAVTWCVFDGFFLYFFLYCFTF